MALPWLETVEVQSDSKFLDRGHPLPPSFFESRSFRALDGLLFAQHEAAYKKLEQDEAVTKKFSRTLSRGPPP